MIRSILLSLAASAATVSAVTYSTNAVVNAPSPTQAYIYKEQPAGTIVLDNAYPVTSALQGTAGAAGGNVELFATGDSDPAYLSPAAGGAFATVPLVTLSGSANNAPFVLSSLNGASWFTTTGGGGYSTVWGATNFANVWFNGLLDALIVKANNAIFTLGVNQNRATLYDSFRDAGGFTETSDPNISYLYEDGGQFHIGLAGFMDQSPRLRVLFPTFANFIPNGLQWSEVVMVNGVPLYSFVGTPSGVVMNDNFGSFNATYALTAPAPQVPEPGTAALLLLPAAAMLRRRR